MVWTQGYQNKNLWTDVNSYAAPYKRLIHDLKRNQQTIDGRKITATTTNQSLQLSQNWPIRTKTRHKYYHLTTTLHLTLKMTTAQVVETSVTNNSLSKDYLHLDDHAKQITHWHSILYLPSLKWQATVAVVLSNWEKTEHVVPMIFST